MKMKKLYFYLCISLILCLCICLFGCDMLSGTQESGGSSENNTIPDSEVDGVIDSEIGNESNEESESKDIAVIPSITIIRGEDLLLDGFEAPFCAAAGEEVIIKTHCIIDADVVVTVNGVRAENYHADSDFWGFRFTMPDDDVLVEIYISGDSPAPNTIYLFYQEPWLFDMEASQITEIRQQHTYIGVAPGTLANIYYTTNTDEIARLLELWRWMTLSEVDESDTQISGGVSLTTTFTLADGTQRSVSFSNGIYYAGAHLALRTDSVPQIRDERITLSALSFISYNDSYKLYTTDGLVGEYTGISEFEFTAYDGPITLQIPTTYIECEFGILRLYSPSLFSFENGYGELRYYSIVGDEDFSFAFE